jgi:UDP-glucose:glycoprotein glucosyltransferase
VLPFDRILGDPLAPPSILYADITSPIFNEFHLKLSALAREGQISYRVRYRTPQHGKLRPLFVSGYGVELVLKRTDYVMIDDRDAQQLQQKDSEVSPGVGLVGEDLKEESPADLKPLSSSEVAKLGLNAASFVMDNAEPFDTLVKLCQDFPRHSGTIANYNASESFLKEFRSDRANILPAGYNAMWINGLQMNPRQIDAYSLLAHLRRERRLIAEFKTLGLLASEVVDLLSHPIITEAQADTEPRRYDYRDGIERGGVIIWLNNLEKDKRYSGWPTSITAVGILSAIPLSSLY